MELRKFIATTIREYLNEQIDNFTDITLYHGTNKNSLPNEILPINDRIVCVNNFKETSNSENWGWSNYNLKKI